MRETREENCVNSMKCGFIAVVMSEGKSESTLGEIACDLLLTFEQKLYIQNILQLMF